MSLELLEASRGLSPVACTEKSGPLGTIAKAI
jgi:hypothetical protein